MVTEHLPSGVSQGAEGNTAPLPTWPHLLPHVWHFHSGQHPHTQTVPPFRTRPGPLVIFVLLHCSARPYRPHHWYQSTSHQALQPRILKPSFPCPYTRAASRPAPELCFHRAGAWKRIQIRELSPPQVLLHTHHSSICLIIPLLQISLPSIGSTTNTTTTHDL